MKKAVVFLLVIGLMSSVVIATDVFRFSGSITGEPDNTISGNVETCGNGVCNSDWEDYINCPADCEFVEWFDVTLLSSDTDALSINTYEDGWNFTFYIDFSHPTGKYIEFLLADFTDGSGHSIVASGNVRMSYLDKDGLRQFYNVKNAFQEPASNFVNEILDESPADGTQATVNIEVKLPTDVYPGSYSADYEVGIFD